MNYLDLKIKERQKELERLKKDPCYIIKGSSYRSICDLYEAITDLIISFNNIAKKSFIIKLLNRLIKTLKNYNKGV